MLTAIEIRLNSIIEMDSMNLEIHKGASTPTPILKYAPLKFDLQIMKSYLLRGCCMISIIPYTNKTIVAYRLSLLLFVMSFFLLRHHSGFTCSSK